MRREAGYMGCPASFFNLTLTSGTEFAAPIKALQKSSTVS